MPGRSTINPKATTGRGRITLTLDGETHNLELDQGHQAENAMLNRFGIFDIQQGGHHVELNLGDLYDTK